MLFEPRYEEERRAEQDDHHGRGGLSRVGVPGQPTAAHQNLVEAFQLSRQRLVLRLELLDALVEFLVLGAAGAHAVLHGVEVLLLPLAGVLG